MVEQHSLKRVYSPFIIHSAGDNPMFVCVEGRMNQCSCDYFKMTNKNRKVYKGIKYIILWKKQQSR